MTKIFVDSDIILDLLKQRQPFNSSAEKIFILADNQHIELFTSALIIVNLHYTLCKTEGKSNAKSILQDLRILVQILPLTTKNIDEALTSNFTDFEDSIQDSIAVEHKMDLIITRNEKDYKNATIPVMAPDSFIQAHLN